MAIEPFQPGTKVGIPKSADEIDVKQAAEPTGCTAPILQMFAKNNRVGKGVFYALLPSP